ncbi:MAG: zinc ribbon domain-containing protein, partial [Burkholderiales bacterium]|nr:zinc ribbon domain-containing protein [Burkholderiales bacterium]
SDGQIRDRIRQWYGSRWFAPNKLKTAALTDTLHGIYLPYWTFDAHASAQWQAQAGYYYYTTETYRDNNGNVQTRQVQHTRWEPAAGQLQHFFDDALVPGTAGVHRALLRQIEPFPTTTDLQPYSPEFVRGWTVERYQINLGQAAKINEEDMDHTLRSLCIRQIPGDTWRNLSMQRQYQGRSFKHVLVPVWLVSYTYGAKTFQIIANGYTGAIAGERPYSWVKISLAVLAALLFLGLLLAVMQNA